MTKNTTEASLKKLNHKDLRRANETLSALLTHDTYQEAAKSLGITEQALINRRNRFGLDQMIAEHINHARAKLQQGSIKAANKLVNMIDDRRHGLEASKEVLDRVGLGANKSGSAMGVEFKDGEKSVRIVVTRSEQ